MIPGATNPLFGQGINTSRINGSPMIGSYDIDPISPGIQTQPGVLTATGPSVFIPASSAVNQNIYNSGYGIRNNGIVGNLGVGAVIPNQRVVDADLIAPGIQAQSGVLTVTGPPQLVSGQGAALGGLAGGAYGGAIAASGIRTSALGVNN